MEQTASEPLFRVRVVAVIGAGRLGRQFAMQCARAGFDVVLEDVMPVNLRRAQDEYEEMTLGSADLGRFSVALTVEDAVARADLAIDFVPDELESKLEIFSLIDRMAPPRTILCTPSIALSITDLASCVYRPERCFAVKGEIAGREAVRVVAAAVHSAAALDATTKFFEQLGRVTTVEADADAPALTKNIAKRVPAG